MEPAEKKDRAELPSIIVPCKDCATPVEIPGDATLQKMANDFGTYCESCMANHTKPPAPNHLRAPFSRFCPPCFEDTTFEQLPCPSKSTLAMDWRFGDQGLNLWGWRGTGKTRTMTLILRCMYDAGHSLIAFGPGDFRKGCEQHGFRRSPWLDKLSKVDVLFFDDMDKMNLTREMEKDLFAVLTNRMGRLPVMLTGNSSGKQIEYHFRLGEPMVRRIRDHCLSIHFTDTDINQKPVTP